MIYGLFISSLTQVVLGVSGDVETYPAPGLGCMFGGVGMQKLARVLCLSFGVEFRVGGLIDMWVAF